MKGKVGEAMAHGLPVVTTSMGAQSMGLVNWKNAMIADSPESFAMAVVELMQNENLYRTVQGNAIDHVNNNYTDIQVGRQIRNVLAEVEDWLIRKMSLSEKTVFFFDYALNFAKKKWNKIAPEKGGLREFSHLMLCLFLNLQRSSLLEQACSF